MQNMRKILLLLTVSIVFLFAACSSGNDKAANDNTIKDGKQTEETSKEDKTEDKDKSEKKDKKDSDEQEEKAEKADKDAIEKTEIKKTTADKQKKSNEVRTEKDKQQSSASSSSEQKAAAQKQSSEQSKTADKPKSTPKQDAPKKQAAPKKESQPSKEKESAKPAPKPKPAEPEKKQETVTISVTFPSGVSGKGLSGQAVPYKDGDSAFDVSKKSSAQIGSRNQFGNQYVHTINGVSEFDHGPNSGWNILVNGSMISVGSSSYKVKPGDKIEWRYTKDYTK